jgi:hypothetical protein
VSSPLISVLLCTVRPDAGYINHPEWGTLQKVVDDLNLQSFKDFELVIVDGLRDQRKDAPLATFRVTWVSPTPSFWTAHRKVAISRYRNSGIAHCNGELIVNLDDCCELPVNYLEYFAHAWTKHRVCLSPCWPESGDSRRRGRVAAIQQALHPSVPGSELRPCPGVYGFGSYPREVALSLNGYNEWFDGAQALEDYEWSTRLCQVGVQMALEEIPGFRIHAQSAHDPSVIDPDEPIVKCCNPAWWAARVWKKNEAIVANLPYDNDVAELLVGPCALLEGTKCMHHLCSVECGYINRGFVTERHPLAWEGVQAERFGFKLAELRR